MSRHGSAAAATASSEITIDGTSVILPENNVSINQTGYTPIVDSIAEFNVITNSLAAEYGRTGGGVINVATRSGTNEFHGSLFEFLRNSKLDANSWANNRNGVPRAAFQRNQFGGTMGGPISIPEAVRRQKPDVLLLRGAEHANTKRRRTRRATVPTRRVEAGRLLRSEERQRPADHALRSADGVLRICLRHARMQFMHGCRFPGNIIPTRAHRSCCAQSLEYFPQPNAVPTNEFTNQNNFFASGKAPSDGRQVRFPHRPQLLRQVPDVWPRLLFDGPSSGFNGFGNIANSLVRQRL